MYFCPKCNYSFDIAKSFSSDSEDKISIKKISDAFKIYESNLIPYLRMMHILDLRSVGWIQINEYYKIEESDKKTFSKIELETTYTNLIPLNDIIKSQKFTILSFDIECTSHDKISFPNPEKINDKVIQIGATISKYGEDECYGKYILTLKGCTKLEGIDVRSFETEEEFEALPQGL